MVCTPFGVFHSSIHVVKVENKGFVQSLVDISASIELSRNVTSARLH